MTGQEREPWRIDEGPGLVLVALHDGELPDWTARKSFIGAPDQHGQRPWLAENWHLDGNALEDLARLVTAGYRVRVRARAVSDATAVVQVVIREGAA